MPHRTNNPGRGAAARWGVSTPLGEQYSASRSYQPIVALFLVGSHGKHTNTMDQAHREPHRDTIQSNHYPRPSVLSSCHPSPSKFNNAHKYTFYSKEDQRRTVHDSTTRSPIYPFSVVFRAAHSIIGMHSSFGGHFYSSLFAVPGRVVRVILAPGPCAATHSHVELSQNSYSAQSTGIVSLTS